MIKGESKNRGHQNTGKAFPLYAENDKVVRAVQMQVGTKLLPQPIQLLYSLELYTYAAAIADARIRDIKAIDDDGSGI